jgi:hypothetical protein
LGSSFAFPLVWVKRRVCSKTAILPEISFVRLGVVPGLNAERSAEVLPCEIDGGVGFMVARVRGQKARTIDGNYSRAAIKRKALRSLDQVLRST